MGEGVMHSGSKKKTSQKNLATSLTTLSHFLPSFQAARFHGAPLSLTAVGRLASTAIIASNICNCLSISPQLLMSGAHY